eukprot:8486087-Alexandrium_andersonii.AAC.1
MDPNWRRGASRSTRWRTHRGWHCPEHSISASQSHSRSSIQGIYEGCDKGGFVPQQVAERWEGRAGSGDRKPHVLLRCVAEARYATPPSHPPDDCVLI